jgi:hypothetical protein
MGADGSSHNRRGRLMSAWPEPGQLDGEIALAGGDFEHAAQIVLAPFGQRHAP